MKKTVIIAGGGTGGHIYPGVAIARALEKDNPHIEVHFVGSAQGLETKIIPREAFPLHLIPAGKLNHGGSVVGKLVTLLRLPLAFFKSAQLLWKLRPVAVLGVGGYASGPFVLTSALLGYNTAIWEPNAFPGMANRWLSRFVRRSFVVFQEAASFLKSKEVIQVGLPVRAQLENLPSLQHTDGEFRVLVFGGSQGARAINNVFKDLVAAESNCLQKMKLVHQTGVHDYAAVKAVYDKSVFDVKCFEYLHEMERHYEWADLVICRSGASTVAELAACGKAAVMIPLPTAADDHQRINAEALAKADAGYLLLQKDLNRKSLEEVILRFKANPELRHLYERNIKKFFVAQAAHKIAELLLK